MNFTSKNPIFEFLWNYEIVYSHPFASIPASKLTHYDIREVKTNQQLSNHDLQLKLIISTYSCGVRKIHILINWYQLLTFQLGFQTTKNHVRCPFLHVGVCMHQSAFPWCKVNPIAINTQEFDWTEKGAKDAVEVWKFNICICEAYIWIYLYFR